MKKIFKYKLKITDEQHLLMPEMANVLCAGMQGEDLFIWAEVDPNVKVISYIFYIFGIGHEIDQSINKKYIGTVHDERGFVWHIFVKA